jgi:hypothetical protein
MSSNATTKLPNDSTPIITSQEQPCPPSQHANTISDSTPLNVDPVTTIFPDEELPLSSAVKKEKSKKKKKGSNSLVKKKSPYVATKKVSKLKKGESSISLTMEDLYLKEDPFNTLKADRNVESSENFNAEVTKADDAKASEETSPTGQSTVNSEKGNFTESLKSGVIESAEILGLYDKIAEKHSSVDDGSKLENNMGDKDNKASNIGADISITVSDATIEIPIMKQNVVPDVPTSLGQQDDQGNMADITVEPNTEVHIEIPVASHRCAA